MIEHRPRPTRTDVSEEAWGSDTSLWASEDEVSLQREVTLLDLVDRVLEKGVLISGDIVLSVADVDLVRLDLRLLLGAVDAITSAGPDNKDGRR